MSTDSRKKLGKLIEGAVSSQPKVDWETKKAEWIAHVDRLYNQVEGYLKASGADDKVEKQRVPHKVMEEFAGTYMIDKLRLRLGDKVIEFKPVGMNIIAARGRVDVTCGNRTAQLLLLGENEEPSVQVHVFASEQEKRTHEEEIRRQPKTPPQALIWKIVRRAPRLEVFPLTEDTFTELLEQLL